MGALANEKCTACRRDSPLVTEAEMLELRPQIPDWTLIEREGIQRLERVFSLKDFAEALSLRIAWVLSPRRKAIIRQFSPNGDG